MTEPNSDFETRKKLLARILVGADESTAETILSLWSEMTTYRLLVAVAKIDPHQTQGLLVIKYGVSAAQAKKARIEAKKKSVTAPPGVL